jgi:hypothetical protein
MELATANDERDERMKPYQARKSGVWEAWCAAISDTCKIADLNSVWLSIEDADRRGDLPSGWFRELEAAKDEHMSILQEQE